jgi:hypothetical protein
MSSGQAHVLECPIHLWVGWKIDEAKTKVQQEKSMSFVEEN